MAEKRIKEFSAEITNKESDKEKAVENLNDKKEALDQKKKELEEIISETKQDEEKLIAKTQKIEKNIDSRLLDAFKRIRKNARNGLAVVGVERNACGGCFNKIPAQRQLDIKSRKKIIVCEYCGRILVDSSENK